MGLGKSTTTFVCYTSKLSMTGLDQIIDHGRYDMYIQAYHKCINVHKILSFLSQDIEIYGTEDAPGQGHKTRTNERAEQLCCC